MHRIQLVSVSSKEIFMNTAVQARTEIYLNTELHQERINYLETLVNISLLCLNKMYQGSY